MPSNLDVDEEGESGVRETKRMNSPLKPSNHEVEAHNLTHLPYRNWCRHCVRGRGSSSVRLRRPLGGSTRQQLWRHLAYLLHPAPSIVYSAPLRPKLLNMLTGRGTPLCTARVPGPRLGHRAPG